VLIDGVTLDPPQVRLDDSRLACLPAIVEIGNNASQLVVRGGVEPLAFRFSGAFAASLYVVGCGLMGDLAAQSMAGCRLMWPGVCWCWLPVWLVWLPGSGGRGRRPGRCG
jgi:hypothetical protein